MFLFDQDHVCVFYVPFHNPWKEWTLWFHCTHFFGLQIAWIRKRKNANQPCSNFTKKNTTPGPWIFIGKILHFWTTNAKLVLWGPVVVWIFGIPENERDCYLEIPLESQTTGLQTTHLPSVELFRPQKTRTTKNVAWFFFAHHPLPLPSSISTHLEI